MTTPPDKKKIDYKESQRSEKEKKEV